MAKLKEKTRKSEQQSAADVKETTMIDTKKTETLDIKIKTISENPDDKTSPIIGYFPSGYDPLGYSKSESDSSVKIYKNASSRNPKKPRMQVVVGASGTNVSFVGTNYSGEATTPQLCNYYLGVLDKETGSLRMVPIAANRIFRLEPKVGGSELPENEPVEEPTAETNADKLRKLTAMYGQKKNVRQDEKLEALRLTDGKPEAEKEMNLQLKQVVANQAALEAVASAANSRNSPPYDLEASSPEMAYPLDKIILKGEWEYLTDIYNLSSSQSELDRADAVYPNFVRNRFDKLATMEDDSQKKRMAGILSYITHLIMYKNKYSIDAVLDAKRHKFPSILIQKFSNMFGGDSGKKKRLPEDKLNLLISYVCVLTLFADDFQSDITDIATDLGKEPVVLRPHYMFLGCKFVQREKCYIATLPIPLQLQTIKRKKRRRG